MRVLNVILAYPPSTGGAQLHAQTLNNWLVSRGHQVRVATLWNRPRSDWIRGTTTKVPPPSIGGRRGTAGGIDVETIDADRMGWHQLAFAVPPYLAGSSISRSAFEGVFADDAARVIAEFQPDVIHMSRIGREWFYESFLQSARAHQIPVVLTANHHGIWDRPWHRWWWDIYRRVDRLIVYSEYERGLMIANGVSPDRIALGVVGPLTDPSPGAPPKHAHGILFLGQIRPYKGILTLVQAMDSIADQLPDATLSIAGPWPEPWRRLRKEIDRRAYVTYLGKVSDSVRDDLIESHSVLCVPSVAESLGGVYLEAWSKGRPAIGGDIPAVRELFSDGGGVAVAQTRTAIADAALKLIRTPGLAEAMGRKGLESISAKYNWEEASRRVCQVYEDAVAEVNPPAD